MLLSYFNILDKFIFQSYLHLAPSIIKILFPIVAKGPALYSITISCTIDACYKVLKMITLPENFYQIITYAFHK